MSEHSNVSCKKENVSGGSLVVGPAGGTLSSHSHPITLHVEEVLQLVLSEMTGVCVL